MKRAVIGVISEVIISLAESTPSATRAMLPEIKPATILEIDNTAFPIILIQDARIMRCSREFARPINNSVSTQR